MMADWDSLERGISAWLRSQHLKKVILEVWNPRADTVVTRWDIEVNYGYTGDGSLWADIDGIKYAIQKAGTVASCCEYRIVVTCADGYPEVVGWTSTGLRSTEHLRRYAVGSTIGGNGIAAETTYWR
jgi:hypothetical protein